jgi:hypothetical protein
MKLVFRLTGISLVLLISGQLGTNFSLLFRAKRKLKLVLYTPGN